MDGGRRARARAGAAPALAVAVALALAASAAGAPPGALAAPREFSWAEAIRGARRGRGVSEEVFRAKGAGAGRAFEIGDFEAPGPFNVSSLVLEVPRTCYW